MAHPGPAEHPLRPRLIRWPTAAPLTDNEEIHHVPSSHLQDLRQDHLGRMRPTRRPGHGRHPQRRALPGPPSPRAVRRLAEQVDRALTPPASALTHRAQCRSDPYGLCGLRTAQPVPHVLPLGRSGAHALEPRPRSPLRHALAEATRWSGGSRLTGTPTVRPGPFDRYARDRSCQACCTRRRLLPILDLCTGDLHRVGPRSACAFSR